MAALFASPEDFDVGEDEATAKQEARRRSEVQRAQSRGRGIVLTRGGGGAASSQASLSAGRAGASRTLAGTA